MKLKLAIAFVAASALMVFFALRSDRVDSRLTPEDPGASMRRESLPSRSPEAEESPTRQEASEPAGSSLPGSRADEDFRLRIRGAAVDSETGSGVFGASVRFWFQDESMSLATDADGSFELDLLGRDGLLIIRVAAEGYLDEVVELPCRRAGGSEELRIELRRYAECVVVGRTQDGEPLEKYLQTLSGDPSLRVAVVARASSELPSEARLENGHRVVYGNDCEFRHYGGALRAPEGVSGALGVLRASLGSEMAIRLSLGGRYLAEEFVRMNLETDRAPRLVTIEVRQEALQGLWSKISVELHDELGGPVRGARVTYRSRSLLSRPQLTDENGRCVFGSVAPGYYFLQATMGGQGRADKIVIVRPDGSPTDVSVTLTLRALEERRFSLHDHDGNIVRGAIRLVSVDDLAAWPPRLELMEARRAGRDGSYRFMVPMGSQMSIAPACPNVAVNPIQVPPNGGVVQVDAGVPVRFVLRVDEGDGFRGACVVRVTDSMGSVTFSRVADAREVIEIRLLSEKYVVDLLDLGGGAVLRSGVLEVSGSGATLRW